MFQHTGMELGDNLKVCMANALQMFRELNRALPDRIIVYRDGVGDGQASAKIGRGEEFGCVTSIFPLFSFSNGLASILPWVLLGALFDSHWPTLSEVVKTQLVLVNLLLAGSCTTRQITVVCLNNEGSINVT